MRNPSMVSSRPFDVTDLKLQRPIVGVSSGSYGMIRLRGRHLEIRGRKSEVARWGSKQERTRAGG